MQCIQIETARLVLRSPLPEDFDAFFAPSRTPDPSHFAFQAKDRMEAWTKFRGRIGMWSLLGYGAFFIFDRECGDYLGDAGLNRFERPLREMMTAPEASWALLDAAQGRGIASEAAQAAHHWFDANFDEPRTLCMIDTDNTASKAVAAKLGYAPFADAIYQESPVTLFERLRSGG